MNTITDFLFSVTNRYETTLGITAAYILGFIEARGDGGMTWDNNPCNPRSEAYDYGRDTFRVLFHQFGICER